jgi:hypothetical protein
MAVSKLNPVVSSAKTKKIASFKSSGSWTVPTGVTSAIAYCIGGGGGTIFNGTAPGAGGTTTVDFPTAVTATGGAGYQGDGNLQLRVSHRNGTDNTGEGGQSGAMENRAEGGGYTVIGGAGQKITGYSTVTPGNSITVTIGAGGTGAGVGGSGYAYIEYYE